MMASPQIRNFCPGTATYNFVGGDFQIEIASGNEVFCAALTAGSLRSAKSYNELHTLVM